MTIYCKNCGCPMEEGTNFCMRCGTKVATTTPVTAPAVVNDNKREEKVRF